MRVQVLLEAAKDVRREIIQNLGRIDDQFPSTQHSSLTVITATLPLVNGKGLARVLRGPGYRDIIASVEDSESPITGPLPPVRTGLWSFRLSPDVEPEQYVAVLRVLKARVINVAALPNADRRVATDGPLFIVSAYSWQPRELQETLATLARQNGHVRPELAPYVSLPRAMNDTFTVEFVKDSDVPGDLLDLMVSVLKAGVTPTVPGTNVPGGQTEDVRYRNRSETRLTCELRWSFNLRLDDLQALIHDAAGEAGFEAAFIFEKQRADLYH